MLTVAELIKQLGEYPANAFAYAYEGEIVGVVVVDADHNELGYILAPDTVA
jgi:hypothetical protein